MSEPGVYRHGTCAIDWSGLTAVVWCEQCGWVGSVPSLSMDGARDAVTQHDYFTHDAKTLSQTYKVTKRKTGLTRQKGACSIEGCERKRASRQGWCDMHWKRWQRHGSTDDARKNRKRAAA